MKKLLLFILILIPTYGISDEKTFNEIIHAEVYSEKDTKDIGECKYKIRSSEEQKCVIKDEKENHDKFWRNACAISSAQAKSDFSARKIYKTCLEKEGNNSNYFLASSLKVNNQSLRCKPDVVLKHKSLDKILIIERKTTRMSDKFVPKDGWANLATQLWCYGWIDEWLDCKDVTLVGQIWQRTWANSLTMLQSHPFYQRNDIRYHAACLNWFQKYGGEFVSPPLES